MCAQLITKFNSIKEWKDYCFNTHSSYFKNMHFRKWINQKDICIFNFSNLRTMGIKYMKLGIEEAIKLSRLPFKVNYGNGNSIKNAINLIGEKINSNELLKMVIKKRKENNKEHAYIFIFNNPIESPNAILKDGESLTYVSEGIMIFTFDEFKKYSRNFLRRRAKHEALHLLGLNSHHDDTKVKGYKHDVFCNMQYNAPTQHLCLKCKDALVSFWRGIEYATKKQFIKN